MTQEKQGWARWKGPTIFFLICFILITIWVNVQTGKIKQKTTNIYINAVESYERINGPLTNEIRIETEDKLKELNDDFNTFLLARYNTSSGNDYLDLTIRIGEITREYNNIMYYKYYYWPNGNVPFGLPDRLEDPIDK